MTVRRGGADRGSPSSAATTPDAVAADAAAPAGLGAVVAVVRAEVAAAARLTLALGLALSLAMFGMVVAKMAVWQVVVPTGDAWTLAGLGVVLGMAIALLVALDQLRDLGLLAIARRLAQRLAAPLVLAVARQPGRSDLAAGQALRDVEEVRRNVSGPVLTGLADAVLVPAILLILLVAHWAFAAWALGFALAAAGLSLLGDRLTRRALVASNEAHARTSTMVADAMRCAEAVEAMGLRGRLAARWEARLAESAAELRRAQTGGRWISAGIAALHAIGSAGALVLGVVLMAGGADVGGGMLLAMLMTGQVIAPFARLGGALHEIAGARAAWARLEGLGGPDVPEAPGLAFPLREPRLTLERVTWAPPGAARPVLREVSLQVMPGEIVALAGPAGAGKTSLLRLAVGMLAPNAGGCFLDGHATRLWEREDFARHVGYLPQDPLLTDGTVAEAVARLGVPDMPEVIAACVAAEAHALVVALPAGYATPIRAEGPLSAGQRQRLALARALYGRPALLVLDEPAAFLDAEGEARLVARLRRLARGGVGVLLTSHRAALLAAADRVLILQNGVLQAAVPTAALPTPRGRAA